MCVWLRCRCGERVGGVCGGCWGCCRGVVTSELLFMDLRFKSSSLCSCVTACFRDCYPTGGDEI